MRIEAPFSHFQSFAFHPVICLFLHQKALRLFICKFMVPNHCPRARWKRACRIYTILLSLHKSRFCLSVSEVKLKEPFRHQNLRNLLNGYKLFPMATTYFVVQKQYLITYVRYIRTRWQPATRSTSCEKLKRQYLVVFFENRPDPNWLETWTTTVWSLQTKRQDIL